MPFLGLLIVGTWLLWASILIHIAIPNGHITVLEFLLFALIIFLMLPGDLLFAGLIILPFYIVGRLVRFLLWWVQNPAKTPVA